VQSETKMPMLARNNGSGHGENIIASGAHSLLRHKNMATTLIFDDLYWVKRLLEWVTC